MVIVKFHFGLISERTTCYLETESWISVPLESLPWFLENVSYLLQIVILILYQASLAQQDTP